MPKLLPALAAAALATALVAVPAAAADAATTPAPRDAYTLSVTGNGTRALVYWSAVRADGRVITDPAQESPITRLPWHRKVPSKATLIQVTAIQQHGTKLRCTIRNTAGKVVSSATSLGRNAVVSCLVSKRDLFSLSDIG